MSAAAPGTSRPRARGEVAGLAGYNFLAMLRRGFFYNAVMSLGWGVSGLLIGGPVADLSIRAGASERAAYRASFVAGAGLALAGLAIFLLTMTRADRRFRESERRRRPPQQAARRGRPTRGRICLPRLIDSAGAHVTSGCGRARAVSTGGQRRPPPRGRSRRTSMSSFMAIAFWTRTRKLWASALSGSTASARRAYSSASV